MDQRGFLVDARVLERLIGRTEYEKSLRGDLDTRQPTILRA
jgi:hypothetical protein